MAKNTGVVQLEILPLLLNALLSVDRLIGDGRSLAAAEVDEVPGPSVSPPPVPKHFAGYDDPSILAGDPPERYVARRPPLSRNWTVIPIGPSLPRETSSPKSASPRHGGRNVLGQGVLEEREDVEQSVDFPRPVCADDDGELGEIPRTSHCGTTR